jgi:hypothetical protein
LSGGFIDKCQRVTEATARNCTTNLRRTKAAKAPGDGRDDGKAAAKFARRRKRQAKRKRKGKLPSGRRSFASREGRQVKGTQPNFAVINAMFDALPAETRAYFSSLDVAAEAAEAAGVARPFGPSPHELSAERARKAATDRRQQIAAAILVALGSDQKLAFAEVVPASLFPTRPVNVCGEFGDSIADLRAYHTAVRQLQSAFHQEVDVVVRKLLSAYNEDPLLNDGARAEVADAFGVSVTDPCFQVLPPLHPTSINVRWHGHGTRDLAEGLCGIHLKTTPGLVLSRCVADAWTQRHVTINVAALPKLGEVPQVASRSWKQHADLLGREGVLTGVMRHAWERVVKKQFPAKSALRTDLQRCEILTAFVGVRDVVPAAAVAADEAIDHSAPEDASRKEEFMYTLINRHSLSPWEGTFMQCISTHDPRGDNDHFISFEVCNKQLDCFEMFDAVARGGPGDGVNMKWCTVFFRLMKRGQAVAQITADLHGAERMFDSGGASGAFEFWGGDPDPDDVESFKRHSTHPSPFIRPRTPSILAHPVPARSAH